jgi:DNA methylase
MLLPGAPEAPVSRAGDLWRLGPHRVLCEDATDREAVAWLLGNNRPRLMVTDAPRGVELDGEWRVRADWSEAFALTPSVEVAYVWHDSEFTREVLNGLLRIGFKYPEQIIWDKGRPTAARAHYWFGHEPAWYVRKKGAPWFGKAGENSTIWSWPSPQFMTGGSGEDKFDRSEEKPVELMRQPIVNYLRRGEVVYDPFLGSGTTLAAAELTKRVCYGMELDPKYVDVAVERWQTLTGKQATHEAGGRSFEEVARERRGCAGHRNGPTAEETNGDE